MSIEGWLALLETTGILDGHFLTRSDAVLAFCCSRMRVSNDVDVQRWTQATHLSFPDFLEALCRLTDMVSLPSEADLIAAPYAGDVEAFHAVRASASLASSARSLSLASPDCNEPPHPTTAAPPCADPATRRLAPDEWQYSQTSELLHARLVRFLPMLFVRLKRALEGNPPIPPAGTVALAAPAAPSGKARRG